MERFNKDLSLYPNMKGSSTSFDCFNRKFNTGSKRQNLVGLFQTLRTQNGRYDWLNSRGAVYSISTLNNFTFSSTVSLPLDITFSPTFRTQTSFKSAHIYACMNMSIPIISYIPFHLCLSTTENMTHYFSISFDVALNCATPINLPD